MAFKLGKGSFLPDKYETRTKPFTGVVSDVKLETTERGTTFIVIELGETEAPLKINLKFDQWVEEEKNGGKTPKPGSPIYKFLVSLADKDIEVEINDDLTEIKLVPSIIGKECSFDVRAKSFNSQEEVDEDGAPKVITFYTWTLKKVSSQSTFADSPVKQVTPPAPVASAPTIDGPADMEMVKYYWLEILKTLPDTFSYPQMIKARGAYLINNKDMSTAEKEQISNAGKVKEYFASLVASQFISQNGTNYVKDNAKIEAGV